MPKRLTMAELRARIDGLALAFFASTQAMTSALVEVHPDDVELPDRMRAEALAMLVELDDLDQEVFPPEALERAFTAVVAAFAPRGQEASNDNG